MQGGREVRCMFDGADVRHSSDFLGHFAFYSNQYLPYHTPLVERIFQSGGGELCACMGVRVVGLMCYKCAA